jgi:hypothetical protein
MFNALLACAALLLGGDPEPDTLHLTNGKTVSGTLLKVTVDEVVVAQGSRTKSYAADKVQSIEGPRVLYPEYVQRLREHFADPDATADQAVALATWCGENGLNRDTDWLYLRALSLDPTHEAAHLALGHDARGDGWSMKVGNGGRTTWEKRLERGRDMKDAWEIDSFHWKVEAAGELGDIVASVAELEQVYLAWFEVFQGPLGFHEIQEPIPAFLHPSHSEFPSQSNNLDAYFHRETRSLNSYFSDGRASRLQHEAVHAVAYYTVREWEKKEPKFPGWLEEGLATYLDASLYGPAGALQLDLGRVDEASFRDHHEAEKKDSLTRVLNYQSSDFGASTGQATKYAESYTLVHYLLHGKGGEYVEGFHQVILLAFRGQGSMSHFKKALGLRKLDGLEEEWEDYVAQLAPKS